ncbi:CTP synthase [Haladaptatus sp. F3-133]|uniref:CTP synthase n=1 Tax=Halorutilus salinus TaxID=2487751 RepID=A0A9Q4C3A4_9EURY|nr:CTP synthase [Halorutilus salinus]MCX2818503.1 CTP synthase [Halorutilus salinus]
MPKNSPRFVFVTGGVMSGLGKGITAASLGRLLKNAGLDVTAVKIDPYLNVDAGTMNPYEHGEVYVLKDGAEVDLDLGNYERYLDTEMTSKHNVTTGKVYRSVIERERSGDYLGKTVQIIPHVTREIKQRIRDCGEGHDVCLVELGGTVGDIEGMPFLEAVRQMGNEQDDEDFLLIHVTLVPVTNNGEQKTKPTQHSVKELREIGLHPDIVVGRSDEALEDETREKISLFCDVPEDAVISAPDVDDIYHVPLFLEDEGLDTYAMDKLGVERRADDTGWRDVVTQEQEGTVEVALAGKYDFEDAYLSVYEALKHAGLRHNVEVETNWVETDRMDENDFARLESADALVVPGGFGERGTEGKLDAVRYARENGVPFLGLCFGFQMAVIEYARNVAGLEGAHSSEIDEGTQHPVIDLLPEQYDIENLGGTMRLGDKETVIDDGTVARELYSAESVVERHRHRFEVNPDYIESLEDEGMVFSGRSASGTRMEILELPDHPFFVGTQFHPEFRSRPGKPSPPFVGLVGAAVEREEEAVNVEEVA